MTDLSDSFMLVLLYQIECKLNASNDLKKVKFQSEEANTDEELKKYLKKYLIENNTINNTKLQKLIVSNDGENQEIKIEDLKKYRISNVYIPEDLTSELKKIINNSKNSIYTNPDLFIEISNTSDIYYKSIELKSTKNNKIPGSSVQQVNPYEWVIFVKRKDDDIHVTTGYYINSITDRIPFPDRSPRPEIAFNTLEDWNAKYRKENDNALCLTYISCINDKKIKILDDWQNCLASEWLEIIKCSKKKNNEKWFNNSIRKFAIKLFEYYNELDEKEKQRIISQLKNNIEIIDKK